MKLLRRPLFRTLICCVMLIALLTACDPFVENNIIEELSPVIFWTITDAGEGKIGISTIVPPLFNEKMRLLTLQVDMLKQGGKDFNLIYNREIKVGQTRVLLIHEDVAQKGLQPILTTILTDPDISQRLYLVIVKGNVNEYFKSQINKQENIDYDLYRMLKHYEKKNQGEITIVNLHEFMKQFYDSYADPVLPVFKARGENFSYEGTAIFRDDKFIATAKTIDDEIMQLMDNDHYLKYLPMVDLSVTLGHVRSKVRMKMSADYSTLSIKVDLQGRVEEYKGEQNILDAAVLASIKPRIESRLEKETIEFLTKLQQWRVDPLNIGSLTLSPFKPALSGQDWERYWEKMKFNVEYRLYLSPLTNTFK